MMMSPAGFEHGAVAGRIHGHLFVFVSQNRLGLVTAAETGFQIGHDPDTVRAPDAAFIRANRLPRMRTRGYFNGPPDLAVEVVSPNDRAGEVLTKVQDWLSAGCPTVWVADPTSQTVSVYHRSGETKLLTVAEELVDDDVLPGFRLSVAEIF